MGIPKHPGRPWGTVPSTADAGPPLLVQGAEGGLVVPTAAPVPWLQFLVKLPRSAHCPALEKLSPGPVAAAHASTPGRNTAQLPAAEAPPAYADGLES